ncbi:peptidase M16 [Clostridia bacterium]|nr:peptidase M16 [Clostridia bacterium]
MTLPNGLKIIADEKQGLLRKAGLLAVRYGSDDMNFADFRTPPGAAHFLEHKLFDLPGGRSVQQLYGALGASPNAYTSHTMTAYHFECTDNFEECLKLLLEYVFTPYFTEESVIRERGIIDQELAMYHDSPRTRMLDELMALTYAVHPARIPIGGTRESIREISAKTLLVCYAAFYTPSNMVLAVSGGVDADRVYELAAELSPKERRPVPRCQYGEEPRLIAAREKTINMDVDLPIMGMGVKLPDSGGDFLRRELLLAAAIDCLVGEISPLGQKLYDSGLIDGSFGGFAFLLRGASALIFSGQSREPRTVRDAVLEAAERFQADGVMLGRAKKSILGAKTRLLDNPAGTARSAAAYYLMGSDFGDIADTLDKITLDDVNTVYSSITNENTSLVTIERG